MRPRFHAVRTAPGQFALRARQAGFSLLELMIVMAIGALIAMLAVPAYTQYMDRARVASAIADVHRIDIAIERFRTQNGSLPDDLGEIGRDDMLDPWGVPYRYLAIAPFVVKGKVKGSVLGKARKDRNLVPINSDYDLYSLGKDGESRPPLAPKVSHDDIVRAGNGGYVGLAENY
ncbi:MAG: prepilin-type N-terminal cleavage/methylation domain-containing protein [Gammaproteobacteria bacterium]|nr:prepilin-type N-terminal cleavage/methylation domain-containing protein [Gammaproteobacteria bacterium]